MRRLHVHALQLAETGIDWNCMGEDEQLRKVARRHLTENTDKPEPCRVATAHNVHSGTRHRKQWGGTAIITRGKLAQTYMGQGEDPTRLGRWVWMRFKGRNGLTLRIVSVYCPNPPSSSGRSKSKDQSVHQQHLKYLNDKNDDRTPRDAFLEDLEEDLTKWLDSGDQLLVMGDFNHHILDDPIFSLFDKYGMKNMIFELHNPNLFPPSCTKSETSNTQIG